MGRATALLCALAVVLVAGCGGGGSAKLTHPQFVSKANAICADYNKRVGALTAPDSYDTVVSYAKKLQTIAEDDVGKFKKLNPPDADRADWQAFAKSGDDLIAAAKDLQRAASKRDSTAIAKVLADTKARSDASKRIATAMGTPACAKT